MSIKKCFLFFCLIIVICCAIFLSYIAFKLRDKKACFPGYKTASEVESLLLMKFPPGSNINDLKDFLNKNKGSSYDKDGEDETIYRCENVVFFVLKSWIIEIKHNSNVVSKIKVTTYLT